MPIKEEELMTYYTIKITGNIAGFPANVLFVNATNVVRDNGRMRMTVDGVKHYLIPKDYELVQIQEQEGFIEQEEAK